MVAFFRFDWQNTIMFTSLIFLILVLLLISLSPEGLPNSPWDFSNHALIIGLGVYTVILLIIFLQNVLFLKKSRKNFTSLYFLANFELIGFLTFFHFYLGAPHFFNNLNFQTVNAIFSLLLYFGGLIVFHATAFNPKHQQRHFKNRWIYTYRDLQVLFPFAIPFLLVTLLADVLTHSLPTHLLVFLNTSWGSVLIFAVTILLILLMMILLPFFIQKIWQCKPLPNSELKSQLEELCQKANFKHAGLKTWTALDHVLTAAIIGVIAKFRYIVFSKRLLREMPKTSILAILAHEIGHSYHRHLWIYPFIILGVSIILSILTLTLPNIPEDTYPFILFLLYSVIVALYFRFIFGFYSRLFERQADLHVFKLNISPEYLIEAFDHIGTTSGNSHDLPNWHHYSIRERMNFLEKAIKKPSLIEQHQKRVKFWVTLYFILLVISTAILIFLTNGDFL